MSNQITAMIKARKQETTRIERIKLRKHLNADAMFATMRSGFKKVKDNRPGNALMLAFLVDQVQQLCCPLFKAAWKKWKTKRSFWEKVRFHFHGFLFNTMEELYYSILYHKAKPFSL